VERFAGKSSGGGGAVHFPDPAERKRHVAYRNSKHNVQVMNEQQRKTAGGGVTSKCRGMTGMAPMAELSVAVVFKGKGTLFTQNSPEKRVETPGMRVTRENRGELRKKKAERRSNSKVDHTSLLELREGGRIGRKRRTSENRHREAMRKQTHDSTRARLCDQCCAKRGSTLRKRRSRMINQVKMPTKS